VAKRLCPQAIIVPVNHEQYRKVSHQVFAILEDFSPAIEPLSIDEAFLDLTGTEQLLGHATTCAKHMKARIKEELSLTASVGIAPNKFLAKLASDLKKPDGLVVIRPEDIDVLLPPMPVTKIWGIGPAMSSRLRMLGISTIGQLRQFPLEVLQQQIGDEAEHYLNLAHGRDDRAVVPDQQAKSIGQEQTFETNIGNPDEISRVLIDQVDQVARRLRKHHLQGRAITLKIRFGDFQTVTRSKSMAKSTDSTAELEEVAVSIWNTWVAQSFQPVRLIGVTVSQFSGDAAQMDLFPDQEHERQRRVDAATDEIRQRFGNDSIKRGGVLRKK